MKIQKIIYSIIMFFILLTTTSFAAGNITITAQTASNSNVSASDGVVFVIESPTEYLQEVGYELYYAQTGMLRNKGTINTGNVTEFIYTISPLSSINGEYELHIIAKTQNDEITEKYIYTVTGGTTNKMTTSSSVPNGSVIEPKTEVTLTVSTGSNKVHMYSVGYAATPTWDNVSTETQKTTGIYTYNYKFIMPKEPGTYTLVIVGKDGFGTIETGKYTYTIAKPKDDNDITFSISPISGSVIEKDTIIKLNAKSTTDVKIKKISFELTDKSGKTLSSNSKTYSSTDASYELKMNGEAGTYIIKYAAEDENGFTKSFMSTYTIKKEEVKQENDISFNVSPSSGSKVLTSSNVNVTANATVNNIEYFSYSIKNSNGVVVDSNSKSYSNKSINYTLKMPSKVGIYTLLLTAKDVEGKTKEHTATYTVEEELKIEEPTVQNDISFMETPVTGSSILKDSTVKMLITSTANRKIKKVSYTVKNESGKELLNKSENTSNSNVSYELKMALSAGTYTLEFTAEDEDGFSKSHKVKYIVYEEKIDNKIDITSSIKTGSKIAPEKEISFKAISSDIDLKNITVTLKGKNYTEEAEGKRALIELEMPEDDGDYEITVKVKDNDGDEATKTFNYTVDSDMENATAEGVIYQGLEDLTVDLWRTSTSRFYEYEDEIEFIAYYYNAESKDKKDVKIEIEIPDDFEVVSANTSVGDVTNSKDTIKFNLGTIEGKTQGEVNFIIKGKDDDACNKITKIVAVIEADDDEEDSSTQLFWVYESGDEGKFTSYLTGYGDGTFRPDNAITREEVATMFARAFGYKLGNATRTFSDLKSTRWSYNYVNACANRNVITGYTDGTFKPTNNITRAELYTMAYKALGLDTNEKSLYVPKEYKKDDSWERDYVAGLIRLGLLIDMDETNPKDYATRADVVYLINRIQFRNPSNVIKGVYSDTYSHWASKDIDSASMTYSFKRGSSGKEKIQ